MLSFPKYESYQSTEEDWLGAIPQHWQLLRTKSIFRLVAEPAPKNNDEELLSVYSDIGVKPRRELEERGNKASTTDGYWLVKKGDIIVNKLLAWMGAIGLSEYDGVTSPAYDILRAYKPINSKFYHYLFRNPICINKLKKHSKGIMEMRLRLYFDEFGNIKIPYPPIEDQNRIVKFLDRKTAEIDQAIEQKQRLIKLLKEQKAILIDRAVTKGLNSNVPMRDSGIEWIGEIPEHWDVKKVKYITRQVIDGAHHTPTYVKDGIPFLRVTDISAGNKIIDLERVKRIPLREHIELCKRSKADKGDILLSKNGTIGVTKVVDWDYEFSLFVSLCLIKPTSDLVPDYFCLFFDSPLVDEQLTFGSKQTSVTNLHLDKIKELLIVLPPVKEQIDLLKDVENQFEPYHELTDAALNEIKLLNEYKQIIIAQAVTGKMKI
jgi:type I restriction enzyme, S subunit